MSMPQHFHIVVISHALKRGGEIAGTVAALLGASDSEIRPYVVPAATLGECRLELSEALAHRGFIFCQAVPPQFFDPRSIDLWLAVNPRGKQLARRMVQDSGPPPDNYYRRAFPDPVQAFGSEIPYPSDEVNLNEWIDEMQVLTRAWRDRIWKAFGDSS